MYPKIGLVYLNRNAEGYLPIRRFIKSYNLFSPGIEHKFITIYKGFDGSNIIREKDKFKNIEHGHIKVDDELTDIDSYLTAARKFSEIDIFCFLNTFSEIKRENWLLYLFNAISIEDVGI